MIWFNTYDVKDITAMATNESIVSLIGIEMVEIGDDYFKVRMPVDARTHQIHGILHGGATCVLAETAGSIASLMCIDLSKYYAVGSQINVNHLRPTKSGYVTAVCKPIHLGRTKHVWDIPIYNDDDKLVAKAELTCAVVDKK